MVISEYKHTKKCGQPPEDRVLLHNLLLDKLNKCRKKKEEK